MDNSGREWLISIICLLVILSASASQSFACGPPYCGDCQKWDPNTLACVDDDSQDEGGDVWGDCGYCQECSDGDCVDDDAAGNSADVCFMCKSCQSGECESDDDECEGCLGCFGFTCDIKHSNCPGDCNRCMSTGACEKFDVLCHDCEYCDATGNCADDGTTCAGCKTCNDIGNCEDDDNAPECDSSTCDDCVDGTCIPGGLCTAGQCCDNGTCVSSCSGGKCCEDSVCVTECSGDKCCDEGTCEALEGCEKCANGITEDDPTKCTGECNNCTDAQCHYDDALCDPGDVCVEGTCCDTAGTGCTVNGEDIGYNVNDCVRNLAGAGQCTGGWGYHIAFGWTQTSTHQNANGPGTVDVDGCADVTYARCLTVPEGLDNKGYVWNCVLDFAAGNITDNMGTHDECPSE